MIFKIYQLHDDHVTQKSCENQSVMTDETASAEVKTSLADMSGAAIQDKHAQDFPRHFWSTAKSGHYRFALAGVAIAAPIAAVIGAAVAATVGWALAPLIIPAFVAAGSLMAVESFGQMGSAAASRASGLAEKHARLLEGETMGKSKLAALDDQLLQDGQRHHYGSSPNEPKKFFSLKSGITGTVLGALSGAVLGLGGTIAHIAPAASLAAAIAKVPAIAALTHAVAGTALAAAAPMVGMAVAGAAVFGLFGLTFGLERKIFKSFFNHTDAITQGATSERGPDLGKSQTSLSDPEFDRARAQRMNNVSALEHDYNDRIFWGSLNGRFRGFAGVVPGVVIGAAAGALALGAAALIGLTGGAALIPIFAAAGGLLGMKVYSEAGTEAGAEATARAIDNEFERNRELRAHGITPQPQKAKSSWLNLKAGVLSTLAGAAVGVALTAVLGPVVGAVAAGHVLGFHLATSTAIAASAVIGGGIGASYGLGDKALKAMAKPATWLYDKAVMPKPVPVPPAVEMAAAQTQPVQYEIITAEDMDRLNQRQAAVSASKSFAQTITQQQLAPVTNVTVSM